MDQDANVVFSSVQLILFFKAKRTHDKLNGYQLNVENFSILVIDQCNSYTASASKLNI